MLLPSNPAFVHIRTVLGEVHHWPTLEELGEGCIVSFVEQATNKSQAFEDDYEVCIAEQGIVPTRSDTWHDICNAWTWRLFPKTKKVLNLRYYASMCIHRNIWTPAMKRTQEENFCTVCNENGLLIAYSDASDRASIENFRWHELFWKRREGLQQRMELFFVGHSLLEKSLHPYIGMTGHAILIQVQDEFWSVPVQKRLAFIDEEAAKRLKGEEFRTSQDMAPFPILGFPGFCFEAEHESFYQNEQYFRSRRRKAK